MAGFRNNGSSRVISTDEFNAKASALSERLGPIVKPEFTRRASRSQRWQDRPLKAVTPEENAETDAPETEVSETDTPEVDGSETDGPETSNEASSED